MKFLTPLLISLVFCKVCIHILPPRQLTDELRLCRKLNYDFCVEVELGILKKEKIALDDLPDEIVDSSLSEAYTSAIGADRYLVKTYDTKVKDADPSQTCLHYWSLAACSEAFSKLGESNSLCYNTCKAVGDHCTSYFLTERCNEIIKLGAHHSVGCVDYASLACNETCVVGDPHHPPPPHHTIKPRLLPTMKPTTHPHAVAQQRTHHLKRHSDDKKNDCSLLTIDFLILLVIVIDFIIEE